MTLHVCRRCDGPCQCDPGLLENEARRWDSEEPVKRWALCWPDQNYTFGRNCRVEHASDYTDREKVEHVKACGKACKGSFWLLHTYPYKNRIDPLDDRMPMHLIGWAEAEEWGEPPPERVQ